MTPEELSQILATVQRLADEHRHLFDRAVRLADHAWFGPTARRFADDLQHYHRALQSELRQALAMVQALHER